MRTVCDRDRRFAALAACWVLLAALSSGFGLAVAQAQVTPATGSDVTVTAKDYYQNAWHTDAERAAASQGTPFPDLKVTVSQTKGLIQQGIQVSYSGGAGKSVQPQGTVVGGANFLQIAECWGDEPGSNGTRPDRRTCQYGGAGYTSLSTTRDGFADTAAVASTDQKYSADQGGYAYTGIPFVAYNSGLVVDEASAPAGNVLINTQQNAAGAVVMKPSADQVQMANNKYFTSLTTNEVSWAPFGANSTGSTPFELQTAMQSPGLGCGSPIAQSDGTRTGQSCWLVIIPRGTKDNGRNQIDTSGLWWDAWRHHVAVKLDFKPLGVSCQLGAAERQLAGSELIAEAVSSWQPVVCQNSSPYTLTQIPESDALLAASGTTPSALALASRPLDMSLVSATTDPLAYAPVALAGISISFAVDSFPSSQLPDRSSAGLPLTDMKLTPRLLAKLLTASYLDALPGGANLSHLGYKSAQDPGKNPRTLVFDQEFLDVNPGWSGQSILGATISDALEPQGRSDLAQRVWEYILADPEAKAWLNGQPDPYGMTVNPCYSINATVSARCPKTDPSAPDTPALVLPRDDFPKADPSEKPDTTVSDPNNGSGVVNLVTARPYASGFTDGAYRVLRGDGMELGSWNRFAMPPKFDKAGRQLIGDRKVIALSSTPAAATYQNATALLRNPAGQFVAPTTQSLTAAAAAMTPATAQAKVVWFDPASDQAKAATDAYPLAVPVYAALNPKQTDAAARAAYADLITYAVNNGQQPGANDGELPAGYAPIPDGWRTQALAAADAIRIGSLPASPANAGANPGSGSSSAPGTTAPGGTANVPGPARSSAAGPASANQPTGATRSANPAASGSPSGALTGSTTPKDPPIGALIAAVPAAGGVGLAAALGIPLATHLRRSPP